MGVEKRAKKPVFAPKFAAYSSGFSGPNYPALACLMAHAFGNFFGAGIRGFIRALTQINL